MRIILDYTHNDPINGIINHYYCIISDGHQKADNGITNGYQKTREPERGVE